MPTIRIATPEDAVAMASVYNYYVEHTAITFDYRVLGEDDMRTKIVTLLHHYPVLVLEENGEILAYAYGSQFRAKMAYQWSVETTVYVKHGEKGKGWGKLIYKTLLTLLEAQGFVNVYGCVTLPNDASDKLHLTCGFSMVGIFPHAGFKHGSWHAIGWYLRVLNTPEENHQTNPIWFEEFRHTAECIALLRANEG